MSVTETLYTARFELPELIERGRLQTLMCRVYRSGALVAPTSGTVSIYKADGSSVVAAAAVTVASSIATYAIAAATTTSLSVEEGWIIEWELTIAGVVSTFRNDAALVRRRLYPVITDADLFLRWKALDPSSATCITSQTTYQDQIDAAWLDIQRRLIRNGNRPNLVMEPSALYEPHLLLVGAMIYEDLASRLNDAYMAISDKQRQHYETAWRSLQFRYDRDDDGTADSLTSKRAAVPTVWLNSAGPRNVGRPGYPR